MSTVNDEDDVDWPAEYIDPDTGQRHGWDELVPSDGGYETGATEGYSYRDLVYDQADAAGMDIQEYLERLDWRRDPWAESDDYPG